MARSTALGIKPMLGRWFSGEDDTPGGAGDAGMLAYGYWQRRYGGDRGDVGRA